MTTTAIREKLMEYIRDAEDEKVEALYLILGREIEETYSWEKDEEFIAELDERVNRIKTGIDKGISLEELEASIEMRRAQRSGI